MAKNKALENASTRFAAMKEKAENKPKAKVPEVGKAQFEVVDCFLGKDHFENKAFEFELKVVGGVNMDRNFTKHIGIECKEPPEGYTSEQIIDWGMAELSKLGLADIERDTVEGLSGAIINGAFHRKKGADATRWPRIYFNSLEQAAPTDDGEAVEAETEDDLDYIEEVN